MKYAIQNECNQIRDDISQVDQYKGHMKSQNDGLPWSRIVGLIKSLRRTTTERWWQKVLKARMKMATYSVQILFTKWKQKKAQPWL